MAHRTWDCLKLSLKNRFFALEFSTTDWRKFAKSYRFSVLRCARNKGIIHSVQKIILCGNESLKQCLRHLCALWGIMTPRSSWIPEDSISERGLHKLSKTHNKTAAETSGKFLPEITHHDGRLRFKLNMKDTPCIVKIREHLKLLTEFVFGFRGMILCPVSCTMAEIAKRRFVGFWNFRLETALGLLLPCWLALHSQVCMLQRLLAD